MKHILIVFIAIFFFSSCSDAVYLHKKSYTFSNQGLVEDFCKSLSSTENSKEDCLLKIDSARFAEYIDTFSCKSSYSFFVDGFDEPDTLLFLEVTVLLEKKLLTETTIWLPTVVNVDGKFPSNVDYGLGNRSNLGDNSFYKNGIIKRNYSYAGAYFEMNQSENNSEYNFEIGCDFIITSEEVRIYQDEMVKYILEDKNQDFLQNFFLVNKTVQVKYQPFQFSNGKEKMTLEELKY